MRLIVPILLIAIAGILFFTITNPFFKDVKKLRNEISIYSEALNNSSELQNIRDELINVYKNIKIEDKDKLESLLPNTIKNVELILEIEKIANINGMPIKNISFDSKILEDEASKGGIVIVDGAEEANLPYGVFPMNFVVDGRYETFLSFLKDLERNLRLVDVKSLTFSVPEEKSKPDDKTDTSIYSYSLDIETYWLK